MAERKPICGFQGESTDDFITALLAVLGAIGTAIGIITAAVETVAKTAIWTLPLIGISAPVGVWLGAVAGAGVAFVVVFMFYWKRCGEEPDRLQACSAGVINEIVPSFESTVDDIFAFTAMHDRVDVVVKCNYWHLVENNAVFIKCANDPLRSPILQGFYENREVCGAGLGATIGAGIGAVGGILAGALVGALIGCATVILCIFAIIVAALIAAAAVIAAAMIGGWIGRGVAEETRPTAEDGNVLSVGDYVTTEGGLITSGDFDGARVYWFVDRTTLHGRSTGSPEFSHTDPDTNLTMDACPAPPVP